MLRVMIYSNSDAGELLEDFFVVPDSIPAEAMRTPHMLALTVRHALEREFDVVEEA